MLKYVAFVGAVAIASLGFGARSATASGGLGGAGASGDTECGATSCSSFAQDSPPAKVSKPAPANTPRDPNAPVCQQVPITWDHLPDQIVDLPDSYSGLDNAYQEQCTQGGKIISSKLVFYPVPSPASAQALAEKAYKTLAMPQPQVVMSPGVNVPQLTGLPLWMWLKPGSWVPQSSTVSAGGITIKATATPQRVEWNMGDGSTVTCPGPGTPFPEHPSGDAMAPSPTCGHTFHRTSEVEPGGAFHVTATIVWRVDWTGFGPGGTFPDVESSVGFPVRVIEAAALVTNSH
ncbi:hypothetical protein ABH926_007109 [Catenulispora sp. GP43]|uniref:hypothetical protein n=1 Tax=Catenulispora sp. GP43 TaxID=3156263 RepID=UPI0035164F74